MFDLPSRPEAPKKPLPAWPLFAASAPGLEPMLAAEIVGLGIAAERVRTVAGGVEVDGDLEALYRLNLELGLALKVLFRVGEFPARRFDVLVKRCAQLPWEQWCSKEVDVDVRVTCKRSKLYHSVAVAERVRAGIAARVGYPIEPIEPVEPSDLVQGKPVIAVHVRIVSDLCTLSIDTSGESLHRRGYRLATAKAPLREDLARALILASGWDRQSPLLDPFCGAGTIPIEADWLARQVPPGHLREFAFMHAPRFDQALWERVRRSALAGVLDNGVPLLGSDRDAGAVRAALANAERAGAKDVQIFEAPLSAAPFFVSPPASRGAVVTNPPYGLRIGHDADLRNLYRALGARVRALSGEWNLAVAVGAAEHARATGLGLKSALMTDHGGSKIYFAVGHTIGHEGERHKRERR